MLISYDTLRKMPAIWLRYALLRLFMIPYAYCAISLRHAATLHAV